MTGWRIGYLTGPAPMLRVMAAVQEQMASCVNAATQRAALAAIRGPQDCVETMRRAYQRRRDLVVERLGRIPGVRCPTPDGAFYAFPDVRAVTHDTRGWPSGSSSTTGWWSRRARRSARGRPASCGSPTPPRTRTWPRACRGSSPGLPPPGEADAAGGVAGQAVGAGAPYPVEWRDGLALVRLTSGKANALNPRSLAAVERALDDAAGGGARGVILTGYERFFSAGLDLVTLYGLERDAMDGFMARFDAVMLRVFAFPRPVVAAIGGHAVAGGAVLALACDARVMGATAGRIGLNEIRLGVPFPASALEIVRHAVPARSVESVLYEGELFDPRAALERGLVTEVTEGDVSTRLAACVAGSRRRPRAPSRPSRPRSRRRPWNARRRRSRRFAAPSWTRGTRPRLAAGSARLARV